MKDRSRIRDRRNSTRIKISSSAIYTRFDNKGRACEQKASKSMDISSGGVRIKSDFPVDSGELLEITIALGPNMVSFKGRVVHANPSEGQGFELGISIEEIDNQDRVALTRFVIQKWRREGI